MKKQIIAAFLLLVSTITLAAPSEPIDQIAAVVNDTVITQNQVNQAYQKTVKQIQNQNAQMPDELTLKSQILNQMIYQELQLQLAKRNHIQATNEQVTTAIKNIAKQHRISVTALKRKLLEQGISYSDYRKQIKKQIEMSILQHQALAKDVKVSDAEVTNFLNKYKSQKKYATQYRIIDVLIPLPAAPTPTQAKQAKVEALNIYDQLKKGGDILKIKGASVNDLGWQTIPDLPDLFANNVRNMKKNAIAGPLRAENGYHIIKLTDIKKGKVALPTRAEVKNILLNQKFQKALHAWVINLRKQSYVKIVHPQ